MVAFCGGRWATTLLVFALSFFVFGAAVDQARAQVNDPATITLTPPAETNMAGEQHCVTATVRDATGDPAPNVVVRFSRSGPNGNSNQQLRTNAAGEARFCYTGNQVGTDTLAVYADTDNDATRDPAEPLAEATKTYVAAAPASVVVSPGTAANEVGQPHCVTATVRDRFGNRPAGVIVRFSVTGANSAAGAGTTDTNGQARFCYTGTRAGTDTIRAHADTNEDLTEDPGEPIGTATKLYRPGPSVAVTVTPAAATNSVGDQHCVTARALDAFGNPRTDAVIVFSVTGANSAGGTVTTNASGDARFCYTGRALGADAIRAFHDKDNDGGLDAGEPVGSAEKTWVPGAPMLLVLEPVAAENPTGQQHCVIATLSDALGNPTPGVLVRFSIIGPNATTGTRTTNSAGEATFCYTGMRIGPDTITAYADTDRDNVQDVGEPVGAAMKTYLPGRPATVVLDPAAAVNETGQMHCVTATVRDEFGNPVGGVRLVFSVTGVNPRGSATRTTDANGEARFCYTGMQAGLDEIQAFVDANGNGARDLVGEPTGAATKTYVPGAPALLTLSPKAATNPVDTQHCLTATVADAFGNPSPQTTVRFTVTGARTTSGSATTNANGDARFCYMGPELPGADSIRAYADTDRDGVQDPTEPFDAAEKTWTPPASTPGCKVTISNGFFYAINGDKATFNGYAEATTEVDASGYQKYRDHGPADPMYLEGDVLAVVCNGDEATIYGTATVDGLAGFTYRIRVHDIGNWCWNEDRYEIIVSNGYTSGDKRLKSGNVSIHQAGGGGVGGPRDDLDDDIDAGDDDSSESDD
jgi:adhesin/invasin